MKRILLFYLVLILVSNVSIGQKTIKMEKDGGIYRISCKINGAPMKMYFDTGASSVSISKATALYLLENDLISKQDFRGKTKTSTADGSIVDNMIINLKDIEISGIHLRNVLATVSYSLNAPLLFGQTAIQRLGRISLQGDFLTIHTDTNINNLSNDTRDDYDRILKHLRDTRHSNQDSQYETLEIIEKIETQDQLNEFELFCKAMALSNLKKFDDAVNASQIWIDNYALTTDSIDWKMRVYHCAAKANILSENGDKEKGMDYLRRCGNYWEKTSNDNDFYWGIYPVLIGEYTDYKKSGYMAYTDATIKTINHFLEKDNLSINMINNNKCPNWRHGHLFMHLYESYYNDIVKDSKQNGNRNLSNYEKSLLNISLILAAKVGVDVAIFDLKERRVDFSRVLYNSEIELVGFK